MRVSGKLRIQITGYQPYLLSRAGTAVVPYIQSLVNLTCFGPEPPLLVRLADPSPIHFLPPHRFAQAGIGLEIAWPSFESWSRCVRFTRPLFWAVSAAIGSACLRDLPETNRITTFIIFHSNWPSLFRSLFPELAHRVI